MGSTTFSTHCADHIARKKRRIAMVWAISMPSDFNDFFPDGNYVGFKESLHKHFAENMVTEERAVFDGNQAKYVLYVGEKFRSELGSRYSSDYPPVSSIEKHEVPECFETEKRYTSLGSLVKLTIRFLAVDDALKEIIEKLEPGKHQFFPIKILMPKGEIYPKRYFVMRIGQWLDSLSSTESKSEVLQKDGENGHYFLFAPTKKYIEGLALSKAAINQVDLWRDRFLSDELIFISDALQNAIGEAGLHMPKHFRVMEV
jgi:hypothetical protein